MTETDRNTAYRYMGKRRQFVGMASTLSIHFIPSPKIPAPATGYYYEEDRQRKEKHFIILRIRQKNQNSKKSCPSCQQSLVFNWMQYRLSAPVAGGCNTAIGGQEQSGCMRPVCHRSSSELQISVCTMLKDAATQSWVGLIY